MEIVVEMYKSTRGCIRFSTTQWAIIRLFKDVKVNLIKRREEKYAYALKFENYTPDDLVAFQ